MRPKVFTPQKPQSMRVTPLQVQHKVQQKPKPLEVVVKKFELNPEMDSLTKSLLETPTLTGMDTAQLESYLSYLKDYTHMKGMNAEYDEAEECSDLLKIVQCELDKRAPKDELKQNEIVNQKKLGFDKEWKSCFSDFDFETAGKLKELAARQDTEKQKFEETWGGEMTRKYRKPSTKLLQLKQIEKSLAGVCEYAQAKSVHHEVEKLSLEEFEAAQKQLLNDYQCAQHMLQKKFKKEEGILIAARNHERGLLVAKMELEKENLQKRDNVISLRPQTQAKSAKRPLTTVQQTLVVTKDIPMTDDLLLPPLIAPNDPKLLEELKKKKDLENKKRSEYQRKNAASTLAKYTFPVSTSSPLSPKELPKPISKSNSSDVYVTGSLEQDSLEVKFVNQISQVE